MRKLSGLLRLGPMNEKAVLAATLVGGLLLAACGSGTNNASTTSPTSASVSSSTTAPPASTTSATCPTLAQAEAALGGSYSGPEQTPTAGGGIVCEYPSSTAAANAGVTIFAHQSAAVFAGQVAHAPGDPAMPAISGIGNGAYGQTVGGRSIVNAYSNSSRTLVAAQSSGTLAQTEALAQVALSDN